MPSDTNFFLLRTREWQAIEVSEPSLLVPDASTDAELYLAYGRIPSDADSGRNSAIRIEPGMPAILHHPGKWYYYYNSASSAVHCRVESWRPECVSSRAPVLGWDGTRLRPARVTDDGHWGADLTAAAPGTATVNASAAGNAIAATADRKFLYVKNISAGSNTISLAFGGQTANINRGCTLEPGEWYSWSKAEGAFLPGEGAVSAISDSAGATLAYQEAT